MNRSTLRNIFYSSNKSRNDDLRKIFLEYDEREDVKISLFPMLCIKEIFNLNELQEIYEICNLKENFIKYIIELYNSDIISNEDDLSIFGNDYIEKIDFETGVNNLMYIYCNIVNLEMLETLNEILDLGVIIEKTEDQKYKFVINEIEEGSIANEIVKKSLINLLNIERQDKPSYMISENEISLIEEVNKLRKYGPSWEDSLKRNHKYHICNDTCRMFMCICNLYEKVENGGYLRYPQ